MEEDNHLWFCWNDFDSLISKLSVVSLIYSVECTFKEFHHLLSELNRCHLDLSELNRLIQSLQTLETSQTVTNGDIRRIISIQVGLAVQSGAANLTSVKQHHVKVKLFYGNFLFFFVFRIFLLRSRRSRGLGRCGATPAHCPEWRPWEW